MSLIIASLAHGLTCQLGSIFCQAADGWENTSLAALGQGTLNIGPLNKMIDHIRNCIILSMSIYFDVKLVTCKGDFSDGGCKLYKK